MTTIIEEKRLLEEYDTLLNQAITEFKPLRLRAKYYIPKLWETLVEYNDRSLMYIGPRKISQLRRKLEKDCEGLWSPKTILECLPDNAKDASKQKGGIASGDVRKNRTNNEVAIYHSINIDFVNKSGPVRIRLEKPGIVVSNDPVKRILIIEYESDVHLPKSDFVGYNPPSPDVKDFYPLPPGGFHSKK